MKPDTLRAVEVIREFVQRRVNINTTAIMMNRLGSKGLVLKYTAKEEEAQEILDFINEKIK